MSSVNEQPYDDWADIYDRVYAYLDYDLPFYVQQATASGGPVLEMGCGTGRVSLAIAEAGIQTVGVDISPRMVEEADRKAMDAGLSTKATFQAGDMLDTRAAGPFSLVLFPFRSFQSMLTVEDQKQALANASSHLAQGGMLALDVFAPDIEQLGSCQMLFVTSAFTQHLDDLKQRLGSRNVLTVSDSPGLAERGVAINFVVVEGKLKFEINTMTLKKAGLRASSQLLKLATLIPVPVTESP